MLPQRTPLRDTDSNQQFRGPELSPHQRGEIIGMRRASTTTRELGHWRVAVRKALDMVEVRDEGKTL